MRAVVFVPDCCFQYSIGDADSHASRLFSRILPPSRPAFNTPLEMHRFAFDKRGIDNNITFNTPLEMPERAGRLARTD